MSAMTTERTQKKRVIDYPYPPEFKDLADVRTYLIRLYMTMKGAGIEGFAGNVFVSDSAPESKLGRDGDICIEY